MRAGDAQQVAAIFGARVSARGLPLGDVDDGALAPGPVTVYDGDSAPAGLTPIEAPSQEDSLEVMAALVDSDSMNLVLQGLARALTKNCPARNDWCELTAIYNGVKNGRSDLGAYGLLNGLRYLADARTGADGSETDVFFKPSRLIAMLQKGENGADCDDQSMLVAALAKNCGFRVGLRAYGEGDVAGGYEHVYPIALIPKRGPWKTDSQGRIDESLIVGMDTTVPQARVGWQPPAGNVFTVMLG